MGKLSYDPEQEHGHNVPDDYGIDFDGPVSVDDMSIDTVEVSEILNDEQRMQLMSCVNLSSPSDSFGIDTYINTLQEVENLLSIEA